MLFPLIILKVFFIRVIKIGYCQMH